MPRLKVFNDVIITDEERAPSPAAAAPAPMPSIVAVPIRDHMETFSDPQERSREKEETEAKTERERKSETDLGPRAGSGSAMCYPLRARDLDREEGDSLSHTAASSTSPRPSTPPILRRPDTDTSADVGTAATADPQSLPQFGSASCRDADDPVPEESERIFKSMVLMYFRQIIHETVESLCPM
jgi:hypothetical protein